jgi:hypothetical protein
MTLDIPTLIKNASIDEIISCLVRIKTMLIIWTDEVIISAKENGNAFI